MAGKPVIAILNTWSDANPCHAHFRLRAEDVKRGVWQAGGFPMEIPVLTLGETFMKPTTMLYRNLLAMETEEALRSYPADGAILLGGCDKTVPAMVMGATSANLPFIFVPAGPMFRGNWRGQPLGSGTDVWKYWAERRAGTIDECTWREMEDGIARSYGTCMTMGTASTMAAAVDALGLTLPGASSIPAADSAHARMASAAGRRIVEMVWEDSTPRDILTTAAFENAVTAAMALGGSTNAIIHLIAMAGRAGADLDLDRFDALSRRTPFLANIRPSGKYLMEDFFYAGGLRGVLDRLRDLLHTDCLTVNGETLGKNIDGAFVSNDDVIMRRESPIGPEGGVAVLRGNLAPDGAVIKHTAAERRLLQHTGPAVVFRNYNDLEARIDDPALPVTARLRAGPAGRRPARCAGNAGVGHAADPEEAPGARGPRHGPDLRRADERHGVRRVCAARGTGVLRRRSAGVRARRRPDRARRRRASPAPCACPTTSWHGGVPDGSRARSRIRAASATCTHGTSRKPTAAVTSISSRAPRRSRSRRYTEIGL